MDTNDPTHTWQSVNHTKVNTVGVELATSLSFLAPRTSHLDISYCYMHQDKRLEDNLQSQYSLEYLRHKLVARLHVGIIKNVMLDVNYRFQDRTGSYTTVNGNIEDYHPYSIVDTRLSWLLSDVELYGELNNLFNKRNYVDYGNVPQPGTWFISGIRLKL